MYHHDVTKNELRILENKLENIFSCIVLIPAVINK